ncbi:MAG: cell envelope integrity protein CreD [Betaproteobacteria bacterium]|nr:cell envelope integrity protein CreD [Betaproteobacteria bacterium]
MQKQLALRIATLLLLILLLMIPLSMIQGLVSVRQQNQSGVEQTIAASLAGEQRIGGPILVVPYVERETEISTDERGRETRRVHERPRQVFFVPEEVTFDVNAATEERYKGLYKALVYRSQAKVAVRFHVPAHLGLAANPANITPGQAWLAWAVSDVRGLSASPHIAWDGKEISSAPGSRFDPVGEGFHTPVGVLDISRDSRHEVTGMIQVAGTRNLAWVPVGKMNRVTLTSSWPHPNFGGSFLPVTREVGAHGFTARWEVSHLASKNVSLLMNGLTHQESQRRQLESFDVCFIEPVNIYLLAERATKYAILFIALTFGGFFLFETLRPLRLHPLQYGLVGMALALFFLLLLSLSEHISFGWAYAVAAVSAIALITYYLSHALKNTRAAAGFGVKLVVLYGVLYALLLSEDNALVMGSILLFMVLAVVMVVTRRVDWYLPASSAKEAAP